MPRLAGSPISLTGDLQLQKAPGDLRPVASRPLEAASRASEASVRVALAGMEEVQTTLTLGDFPPWFLWPQTRLRAIFKAQSAAD